MRRSRLLTRLLANWPGKRAFGPYRFLPIYFVLGAVVEFCMIKWEVGDVNFYKEYKRKLAERSVANSSS
uniref:Putative conserved protein with signal anchor n=1 Tax=Ornithodoros turicata TaxID=34597 RepID=A0A2R5LNY0_9ACAR